MDSENNRASSGSRRNVWEEITNWSSEHPLASDADRSVDNDLPEKDSDSFGSPKYLAYGNKKIDLVAKGRADIYAPIDKEVKRNLAPFVELVQSDISTLLDVGSKMEIGNISVENISELIDYFCAKFNVDEKPKVELTEKGDSSCSNDCSRIKIRINKTGSIAGLISTISHEVWHIHQYGSDSELYEYNFENYYQPSMDYDTYKAYRTQLVEKEAHFLDESIGRLYRIADLKSHPEKIPNLLKLFSEWLAKKYDPEGVEDGLDFEYIRIAAQIEDLKNKKKAFEDTKRGLDLEKKSGEEMPERIKELQEQLQRLHLIITELELELGIGSEQWSRRYYQNDI